MHLKHFNSQWIVAIPTVTSDCAPHLSRVMGVGEVRVKTKITENSPIWSHGSQPCLTQWNYEPCRVGPPKTDGSWQRVLTKCGPLEKGMANHFSQYSCLENPMNSMKRQEDRTLKDDFPRSVGAQHATGDQWRNNSRKNEETEPKQKTKQNKTKKNKTQLWMWLVIEVKLDAVKSNIA